MARRGIYCIEGPWTAQLRNRASVEPLLKFVTDAKPVKVIHEKAPNLEALQDLTRRWQQRQYSDYKLGYLAFHGTPGHLHLGRRRVSLDELAEQLEGSCAGKILYFGACNTLRVSPSDIEALRRRTKAKAIAGYTKDVDWFEVAAFELLLFDGLTHYVRSDALHRWLQTNHPGMVRRLGFKLFWG